MIEPFFTPSEVEAMQDMVLPGFQTSLVIRRQIVTAGGSPSTDYGDDDVSYSASGVSSRNVKGWFYSTPTQTQVIDTGAIVTVNTYRLWVPVGTDILPGDEVVVGEAVYIVSDTTEDRTWPALLACNLRRRE